MAVKVKDIDMLIHKVPPQSIEAEQSVLGGILLENEAINRTLEVLGADASENFYREIHRKIFLTMLELNEKSEPVDLITLSDALKDKGWLEEIGGTIYLASLADSVPTAANITHYAKIVKEKALLRRLIRVATEIVTQGYELPGNVEEFLDRSERSIFEVSEKLVKPSYFSIRDLIKDSFKYIDQRYEKKELITGIPTGFSDFDLKTTGLQCADLIIIAGRPSMGKTSLSLNIAQYAAIEANVPVVIFSLEMAKEQLVLRMLCSEARVDANRLRGGFLSESDWPRLTNAAGRLSEAPIFIDDTPAISVLEMRAKARRLKADNSLGLIIVDYLQLMQGRRDVESREREISDISRSLKALAKELSVPVVALSQLSRRTEQHPGNRPQLADLRESGAIEQDADVVVFIYRDELYNPDTEDKGIAEVIIGKQRNGPTGVVKLAFQPSYTNFENLSDRGEGSEDRSEPF
ncbi:MAG: replicative DNA helicase [Deltaproteobacteria bacterium]|nr:MAG: replicative DNA helicase [Deltaproteobacteria bacterium]